MIVLGLTGSIGMGKSTAAAMFRRLGVPVFDADQCVHQLYDGAAVGAVAAIFPGALHDGRIDRKALGALVLNKPDAMAQLEGVIHPLVQAQRQTFLNRSRSAGSRIAVIDIPLLFETRSGGEVDAIVVVSAGAAEQRRRVLARPDMTAEKLEALLRRQTPDAEKRRRAHFIVQTRLSLQSTERQIRTIVASMSVCERSAS